MAEGIVERHYDRIAGVLSCYDRIIITGTLPGISYAKGMTAFLRANGIRIFDYPQLAAELRDVVRETAARIAEAAGVSIEHIAKSHIRKDLRLWRVADGGWRADRAYAGPWRQDAQPCRRHGRDHRLERFLG
jgi:hypothetical protein